MANELEQKARELLAAEYERRGYRHQAAGVRAGEYPAYDEQKDITCKAIVAALQQTQQPGAQAVAWEVRRTDLCANGRWEACTHDAYLDTIATGRYCGFKKGPSAEGRALYTDPPPLPEGVSEEDVEVAIAAYGRSAGFGDSPRRMRAALESYRARLAAKAGGDRAG